MIKKAQSAMEYLMTYGWSILLIAIVVAALYSLGIFSNGNLAPKAQPGSCQVFRPYGPGSTSNLNLEGVCAGVLPKYVASFPSLSTYISIPSVKTGSAGITVTAWVYLRGGPTDGIASCETGIVGNFANNANGFALEPYTCQGGVFYMQSGYYGGRPPGMGVYPPYSSDHIIPIGIWEFMAATYNSSTGTTVTYLNLNSTTTTSTTNLRFSSNSPVYIGTNGWFQTENLNGSVANVQIYNTALDPNSITAIYDSGIGGAPINLQNLAAWWPLNGDTKDYSGNANNGASTGIVFTSSWTNGYTTP